MVDIKKMIEESRATLESAPVSAKGKVTVFKHMVNQQVVDMTSFKTGVEIKRREVNGYTELDSEEVPTAETGSPLDVSGPDPLDRIDELCMSKQAREETCIECFLISRRELMVDGVCSSCR